MTSTQQRQPLQGFVHLFGQALRSAGATLLLAALWSPTGAAQSPAHASGEVPGNKAGEKFGETADTTLAQIDAILSDKRVARRITAWGLGVGDVRHDVHAMSAAQRAQLLRVMQRRWPSDVGQSVAALQAQFLVTVSLMRESTLFASILSPGNSRSFQ